MADQKEPEIVSLDDLLSGGSSSTDRPVVAPTPPTPPPGATAPGAATAAPETPRAPSELEEIDALLGQQDPDFLAKMSELKTAIASKDSEVIIPEVESDPHFIIALLKRLIDVARYDLVGALKRLGIVARETAILAGKSTWKWLKDLNAEFKALPGNKKLRVYALIILPVVALWIAKYTFTTSYLPRIDPTYMHSVAEYADATYQFDPLNDLEDFDTPLRQPEFIVLIDRFTVVLSGKDGAPPGMGMFELYIEASTREGAIELKDREREVRDVLARTAELITYKELITIEGKEKLKRAMRRRLNEELMTVGRVRTVYFQNLILKP